MVFYYLNNCFTLLSLIAPIRLGWMCILDFLFGLLLWWLLFTYTIFLVHWMNSKLFFMFFTLQFKIWKVWKLWVYLCRSKGWHCPLCPPLVYAFSQGHFLLLIKFNKKNHSLAVCIKHYGIYFLDTNEIDIVN